MKKRLLFRLIAFVTVAAIIITVSRRPRADSGICDGVNVALPFTDVAGSFFFCEIAAAYFSGLTSGTTSTTYSPNANVTRDQMAAFTTRTLDQSLKRGSQRATLNQWWTPVPQYDIGLGVTSVGIEPGGVRSDGKDVWVADYTGNAVVRVRASDARVLETWTGATNASDVLVALGRVFVTGQTSPGKLYMIDPSQPPGAVTVVAANLGNEPGSITFDGSRIWVANSGSGGGVSIITPQATLPWSVRVVTADLDFVRSVIYDGSNVWAAYFSSGVVKLDSSGTVVNSIPIGGSPGLIAFDGINIWVPRITDGAVSVVRASTGTILANLTGNGLNFPVAAAFDGERILITNEEGHSVSLWKATDLTPLGSFSTGTQGRPFEVCSDGLNFWITMVDSGKLARF